jgi:hypothetical protein
VAGVRSTWSDYIANSYGHCGDHIDALEELVLSSELPA